MKRSFEIVNPENEQKLSVYYEDEVIDGIEICEEYAEEDEYIREMLVTTNKYYDWTSYREHFIKSYIDDYMELRTAIDNMDDYDEEEKQETKQEYNELIKKMKKEWEDKEKEMSSLRHDANFASFTDVIDEMDGLF